MVKFPVANVQATFDGGRFWHAKIEMRAAQETWTHEAECRTHSNKQRDKLLAILRRCGFIRSSSGRTTMLLRLIRLMSV